MNTVSMPSIRLSIFTALLWAAFCMASPLQATAQNQAADTTLRERIKQRVADRVVEIGGHWTFIRLVSFVGLPHRINPFRVKLPVLVTDAELVHLVMNPVFILFKNLLECKLLVICHCETPSFIQNSFLS